MVITPITFTVLLNLDSRFIMLLTWCDHAHHCNHKTDRFSILLSNSYFSYFIKNVVQMEMHLIFSIQRM